MTSSPHGPYVRGDTRATMAGTTGCELARGSQSRKTGLSPDTRLQLASLKSESLVIADQQAAVNTFPGLVHTARHTMGAGGSRRRGADRKGAAAEGVARDWGEVVTR
jgi:hypothetical protein